MGLKRWVTAYVGLLLAPLGGVCQQSLADALAARGSVVASPVDDVSSGPTASLEAALQGMFAASDVVFAGEVMRVSSGAGFVEVHFRVDEPVRGVNGSSYTLREWSGLWTDHARYVVGQRLLMLLHAPSAAGFASPVGGIDGAIPLAGNDAGASVDLRWVATHAVPQRGRLSASTVSATALDAGAAVPEQAAEHVDRGVVMGLLHAWQRSAAVRR